MFTLFTQTMPAYVTHLAFSNTLHNLNNIYTDCGEGEDTNFTTVDLSPLSNLASPFGHGLFSKCIGLTTLDLPSLHNVTIIDNFFLYRCINLAVVDLSGLTNVTTIGENFLSGCSSLTAVDLSPLANITAVGHSPLSGYQGTAPIDLSGLFAI